MLHRKLEEHLIGTDKSKFIERFCKVFKDTDDASPQNS